MPAAGGLSPKEARCMPHPAEGRPDISELTAETLGSLPASLTLKA